MPQNIFKKLMQKCSCDTDNYLSTVGFNSKYGNYYISFHAFEEDDHQLIVEDFGRQSKIWNQMASTQKQRNQMQKIIADRVDEINKIPKPVYSSPDNYETLGLRPEMFY